MVVPFAAREPAPYILATAVDRRRRFAATLGARRYFAAALDARRYFAAALGPRRRFAAALVSIALFACSADQIPPPCGVTGRQRTCSCPAPAIGIQVCGFNGFWERCQCYRAGTPAAGAPAAIGGGGGSRAAAGGTGGTAGNAAAGAAGRR